MILCLGFQTPSILLISLAPQPLATRYRNHFIYGISQGNPSNTTLCWEDTDQENQRHHNYEVLGTCSILPPREYKLLRSCFRLTFELVIILVFELMLDGRWVGVSSTPHKSRATLQCGSGAGWVQLCPSIPPILGAVMQLYPSTSCAVVQLCSCAPPPLPSSVVHLCIFEDICLTLDRQRIWGTKEKMCGHIARRKLSHSQALFVICRIQMGKKFLKVKWYQNRKVFRILRTCRCHV